MRSKLFPIVRGLMGGFIISLINGFSLPLLFELFVLILSILKTGHWYGPIAIAELWFIQFVFGFGCSLPPGLVAGVVLSVVLFSLPPRTTSWLKLSVGAIAGVIMTIFYVMLLSFFEIVNVDESSLWAAFILIEEIGIYGWVASRWGRRGVIRGSG
ncbi:MAG: hypothetical protein ACPLYD_16245 [Anaerolineae bacterium]|uniref:hypothetical protein n=1 Tax=Thermogutta sp. TaxID=1962930 RepID=UPI0032201D12